MRKIILVAALLAASITHAADNVTVFGTVDVETVVSNGDGLNQTIDTQSQANSQFGLKGSEDLGDGLKAFWKMSFGTTAEGQAKGSIKNKDMYLGLKGSFGEISMGQRKGFLGVAGDKTIDNIYSSSVDNDVSIKGRRGNSLWYVTPSFDGFQAGINTMTDGGAGQDKLDTQEYMASYTNADVLVVGVYLDDNVSGNSNTYIGVNGSLAKMGYDQIRLVAGYEAINNAVGADVDIWTLGGTYVIGNNDINVSYQDNDSTGTSFSSELAHNFSKRTAIYTAYNVFNADATNSDTTTLTAGMQHKF